jgi:hypothetical protein
MQPRASRCGPPPSLVEDRAQYCNAWGDLDDRVMTVQWHADRASTSCRMHAASGTPKPGKLASNPALCVYVHDRLSGLIAIPDGIAFDGPAARVLPKGYRSQPA